MRATIFKSYQVFQDQLLFIVTKFCIIYKIEEAMCMLLVWWKELKMCNDYNSTTIIVGFVLRT